MHGNRCADLGQVALVKIDQWDHHPPLAAVVKDQGDVGPLAALICS